MHNGSEAMNVENIRKIYPTLNRKYNNKKIIYFDNACSLLKPKCVIDALVNYYEYLGSCAGGRSDHILAQKTEEICDKAREQVRDFINARYSCEIIWTKNTTEGINLIANSFHFSKLKKEVIVFNIEHHSNLLPFYEAEKQKRIKLIILKVKQDGEIDLGELKKNITNRTALISFAHSSNVLSVTQPVKEIARIAHLKGAYILVDDAQYIATHKEDVKNNDIDFLVFSGHKLGGPTGIGVFYGKKELLKRFRPYQVGGGTVESVILDKFDRLQVKYLSSPKGLEAGVQHYDGIIGLGKAIDFIKYIGYKNISSKVESLTRHLFLKLQEIEGVKILGDYKTVPVGSLLSFYFNRQDLSLYDFNIFLNQRVKGYSILVRCGHHCALPIHQYFKQNISMRLSFFIYNSQEEIDIFINGIKSYLKS